MKRKSKPQGKPRGANFADVLAMQKAKREALQQAANDLTVEVRANTATQRALWLAVVSIADAYGFGKERMKPFFKALQENSDELNRMREEVDEEYAYEKLRQKAQRVTGVEIEYLYEHEALAAQVNQAREAVGG